MLHLLVMLVVLCLVVWGLNTVLPDSAGIKKVINVVAIIIAILMALSYFFPGALSGTGIHCCG